MKISIFLKKIIASFFFYSGLFRYKIAQHAMSGKFCILMYHRITHPVEAIQAGMYVRPDTFRNHLKLLQKYFTIVSLDKLEILQKKSGADRGGKPLCALTFDDGWRDFYDFAFPCLREYKISATVFLPTEFIDNSKQFWTESFAYLLFHRQTTTLEKLSDPDNFISVNHLDRLSGSFDKNLEEGIEYLKEFPLRNIENILVGLSEIWQVSVDGSVRDFLTWEEIAEMKNSGLISFGSHTVNHQILTTLDGTSIKKELIDSRKKLYEKNVLDSSCVSFCYPNGNHTNEIADMVRSSGYNLAVTTRNGWNHTDTDKFILKRVGLHEDMTSTTALFACRVAGLI